MTNKKQTISIGLLGLGVVGNAFARLVQEQRIKIQKFSNCTVIIKKALVRNVNRTLNDSTKHIELVRDFSSMLTDDIDLIVDVMGGVDPVFEYLQQAMRAKKPVITANKNVVAEKGSQLLPAFERAGLPFLYEAAVAGSVPIVQILKHTWALQDVHKITGILNGTNNFILDSMLTNNTSFDVALQQAKELGFAESDASFDIQGNDAVYKISILGALAFHTDVDFHRVVCEGIESVTIEQLKTAQKSGYAIKHIACIEKKREKWSAFVWPCLINTGHALAFTQGAYNAVRLNSLTFGEASYYGLGAGGTPTATALMSDLQEMFPFFQNTNVGFLTKQFPCALVESLEFDETPMQFSWGIVCKNAQALAPTLKQYLLKPPSDTTAVLTTKPMHLSGIKRLIETCHQPHNVLGFWPILE